MSNQELLHQPATRVVELDIEGMTCASCVNRVEKKLGKLDGVQASVNLPLESAHVTVPAGITDEQIKATVEAAGYKATIRQPDRQDESPAGEAADLPAAKLRPRLILAAILTVPVFIISMVPGAQFPHWGWAAALSRRWAFRDSILGN